MRILLDTNILITGLFVPKSKSQAVLSLIREGEISGFITPSIIDEGEKVLERAYLNTGLDLRDAFSRAINDLGLNEIDDVAERHLSKYPNIKGNTDTKILAASAENNLILCTNDIRDFSASSEYGVPVKQPLEIIQDGEIKLDNIILGFVSSLREGTFYIEFEAVWTQLSLDRSLDKRFYMFDIIGLGGLFFDNITQSFVFEHENGNIARIKVDSFFDDVPPVKLALVYDCNSGFSIYHGYQGKKAKFSCAWEPPAVVEKSVTVGSDRNIDNHLNGWLSLLFSLPHALTERGINNIISEKVVRSPLDRFSIEDVIEDLYNYRALVFKGKGSICRRIQHADPEWLNNDQPYTLPEIQIQGLRIKTKKRENRTIELVLIDAVGREFSHIFDIPECDDRGLFIALTWNDLVVLLYINGKLVKRKKVDFLPFD